MTPCMQGLLVWARFARPGRSPGTPSWYNQKYWIDEMDNGREWKIKKSKMDIAYMDPPGLHGFFFILNNFLLILDRPVQF